jgi:hypothetical protein
MRMDSEQAARSYEALGSLRSLHALHSPQFPHALSF